MSVRLATALAAAVALVAAAPATGGAVEDVVALRAVTDAWRYVNDAEAVAHAALAPETSPPVAEQLVKTRMEPLLRKAVGEQPRLDRLLASTRVTTKSGRLLKAFNRRALKRQAGIARKFLKELAAQPRRPFTAAERFAERMAAERRRVSRDLQKLLDAMPARERAQILAAMEQGP